MHGDSTEKPTSVALGDFVRQIKSCCPTRELYYKVVAEAGSSLWGRRVTIRTRDGHEFDIAAHMLTTADPVEEACFKHSALWRVMYQRQVEGKDITWVPAGGPRREGVVERRERLDRMAEFSANPRFGGVNELRPV